MKVIKIGNDLILKEKIHWIDRKIDKMFVKLEVETLYGVVYQEKYKFKLEEFDIYIQKYDLFPRWAKLKDLTRDEFIEYIFNNFLIFKKIENYFNAFVRPTTFRTENERIEDKSWLAAEKTYEDAKNTFYPFSDNIQLMECLNSDTLKLITVG